MQNPKSDATKFKSDPNGFSKSVSDIIMSLGLVFGDIGTSPIYTLSVIFLTVPVNEENVIGIVSLLIWTLIILVTGEYVWLAMRLSKRGEGGAIVLREILLPMLKSGRRVAFATVLTILGISLFIGDGVITPAISILSAVEGLHFIPNLQIDQNIIVIIAIVITIGLFLFQKRGTGSVAKAFGPIMLVWFFSLAISGIYAIYQAPQVIAAISPTYALLFLFKNGFASFFILSEVILCATGGEALYADIGHLGKKPIIRAWFFVFIVLVLSYLGQGAYALARSDSGNLLFGMINSQASILYLPFLLISIAATVIASQAMISGVFSVMYQAIQTRLLPRLHIKFTSEEMKSQIYIRSINWLLCAAVLIIIILFEESSALASAYGLAVTGSMTITGIMMTLIFHFKQQKPFVYYEKKTKRYMISSALVTIVAGIFFVSTCAKIPHGGYISLLIAGILLIISSIYIVGHRRLEKSLGSITLKKFSTEFNQYYKKADRIMGTAVFLTRTQDKLPSYIPYAMFKKNLIHEENVLLTLKVLDEPYGLNVVFNQIPTKGLSLYEIQTGYMEIKIDFDSLLKSVGIKEHVIFYGVEKIIPKGLLSKAYARLDRITPSFVQFYRLPQNKLHEVVIKIKM